MTKIFKLFIVILCLLTNGKVYAQDPRELINIYLAKVSKGDVRNWETIKTAYIESVGFYNQNSYDQKTIDLRQQKNTLHKLYRQWPDKSREDLYENDTVLTSSFFHVGKDHFFVMKNMAPMPLSSGPYDPYFEFLPVTIYNTLSRSTSVKNLGIKSMDGKEFHEIKLVTKNLIWYLYINLETQLIEYWNNSPDGDQSNITKVFDYQAFDGFLIPLSEVKTRNGVLFFLSEIRKLELNKPIDPTVFRYKAK